jgi:DNA-binding transcriptional regulator YbjK
MRQRLDDLLFAQATEGVSEAEARELEQLLAAHPKVDAHSYERAAAAVTLALLGSARALPDRLRERLERSAAAERVARDP